MNDLLSFSTHPAPMLAEAFQFRESLASGHFRIDIGSEGGQTKITICLSEMLWRRRVSKAREEGGRVAL